MKSKTNTLEFLLNLNTELEGRELAGEPIMGPGLPPIAKDVHTLITTDCVQMPPDA